MPPPAIRQVKLVAAAAGPSDGELMIETDGDNLGASHIVSGEASGKAIKVPSLRLQRILEDAGVSRVDALKIDVEGYEDRVLTGFFREAPPALWPRAVVIEHLSRDEWLQDCIADMRARGYAETGTDPQQHAAGAKCPELRGSIAPRRAVVWDDRNADRSARGSADQSRDSRRSRPQEKPSGTVHAPRCRRR